MDVKSIVSSGYLKLNIISDLSNQVNKLCGHHSVKAYMLSSFNYYRNNCDPNLLNNSSATKNGFVNNDTND